MGTESLSPPAPPCNGHPSNGHGTSPENHTSISKGKGTGTRVIRSVSSCLIILLLPFFSALFFLSISQWLIVPLEYYTHELKPPVEEGGRFVSSFSTPMAFTPQENYTIQFLVLSPKVGYLVALGTTDYASCGFENPVRYTRDNGGATLELSYNSTMDDENATLVQDAEGHTRFVRRIRPVSVLHKDLQGGSIVVAWYRIDVQDWKAIRKEAASSAHHHHHHNYNDTSATTTTTSLPLSTLLPLLSTASYTHRTMTIHDEIRKTTHPLPVLVDTHPRTHFLSATTTVRKTYLYYQAFRRDFSKEKSTTNGWSDERTLRNLHDWMRHYRYLGVTHFYIVDNEMNRTKPNLQINTSYVTDFASQPAGVGYPAEKVDVTYIRTSVLYDSWMCRHKPKPQQQQQQQQQQSQSDSEKSKQQASSTEKKASAMVSGQLLLENTILRLAKTKWLFSADLDEFAIPALPKFQHSLPKLIHRYKTQLCAPPHNPVCHAIYNHTLEKVYAIGLVPEILWSSNPDGGVDWTNEGTPKQYGPDWNAVLARQDPYFRAKVFVRPDKTETLSVHYPRPVGMLNEEEEKLYRASMVKREEGYFVHFRKVPVGKDRKGWRHEPVVPLVWLVGNMTGEDFTRIGDNEGDSEGEGENEEEGESQGEGAFGNGNLTTRQHVNGTLPDKF